MTDEWDLATQSLQVGSWWKFATISHNEHRFVLSRAVWVGLLRATDYEFRAPMIATVVALTTAGFAATVLAARVRGRSSLADVVFPALLLHWGHRFNLLMGYQVGFALVVVLVTGLIAQVVRAADPGQRRVGLWAGVWLAALALQGGFGLAFVPPVGLWIGYLVLRRWRVGGPGRWGDAVATLTVPGLAAAYTAWHLLTLPTRAGATTSEPFHVQHILALGDHLLVGVGSWVARLGPAIPVAESLVLLVYAAAAVWCARAGWRDPAERPRALGLLALLVGQVIQAGGIALARGGGLADRFVTPSAVGLIICGLAAVAYGPRISPRFAAGVGVLIAAGLFAVNIGPGKQFGWAWRNVLRSMDADIRAGWSPTFLAGKYCQSPPIQIGEDRLPGELDLFRRRRVGPFSALSPDPLMTTTPVGLGLPLVLPDFSSRPAGHRPPGLSLAPPARAVVGLRLVVEQKHWVPWSELALRWRGGPDGQTPREEIAYPAFRPHTHSLTFFLRGDTPTDIRLESTCPTFGLTVHRAEWLVTPETP